MSGKDISARVTHNILSINHLNNDQNVDENDSVSLFSVWTFYIALNNFILYLVICHVRPFPRTYLGPIRKTHFLFCEWRLIFCPPHSVSFSLFRGQKCQNRRSEFRCFIIVMLYRGLWDVIIPKDRFLGLLPEAGEHFKSWGSCSCTYSALATLPI